MRHTIEDFLNVNPRCIQFVLMLALDDFIKQNQFLRSNGIISKSTLVLADETFFQ